MNISYKHFSQEHIPAHGIPNIRYKACALLVNIDMRLKHNTTELSLSKSFVIAAIVVAAVFCV